MMNSVAFVALLVSTSQGKAGKNNLKIHARVFVV